MTVSLFTPVLKVIQAVHDLTKEHKGIVSQLSLGIRSLGNDMETIQEDIAAYEEHKLQELAYEIEDFLHGLTTPGALGFVLTVLGRNPGDGQLATVEYFKDQIKKLENRQESRSRRGQASAAPVAYSGSGSSTVNHDALLVGNSKLEFQELLSAVDAAHLAVISIVGCRGLGKTALARAVYKEASVAPDGFLYKAWVVASEYKGNVQGLLNKILEEIVTESESESESGSSSSLVRRPVTTQESIHAKLQNKRYLVVIDDMLDKQMWDIIKSAFPDTAGSIIVVTTSIQTIATYVGRHRYTMPYLDIDSSRKLLHQTMGNLPRRPIANEEMILRKCDGIPLTLVSVATHLRWNLRDRNCSTDVAKSLGTHIAGNGQAFGDLKRTLVECYESLPGYQDRRCLLSVSMFPQGHRINMKSLLRKWIAEGLVANQEQRDAMTIARNSSKEFLERSIVDPVLIGNNSAVKRCQVNGTMLEFIVYNSTCATNFATLVHPHGIRLPTASKGHPIRRLFVWDGRIEEETDVCVIRWLTLCNSVLFDVSKCRLLRVLDLEGCTGIVREVLQNICKLVFLKYLSLRFSDASEIPKEIEMLVNLETLDIRGTKVKVLPIKVAMMPGLVHLFGQFELVSHWPESIIEKSAHMGKGKLHKKTKLPSKLETLAGVIIQKDERCFEQIMLHSKKLKKVNILCNKTAATDLIPLEKFCGEEVLERLSVDCSEPIRLLSGEFLESSSVPFAINSLKLTGKLEGLPATPDNFMKLQKVVELQLSSTGRRWEELSVLQKMYGLVYLTLLEDHHVSGDESNFIVEKDGFPELDRLCIRAPRLPKMQFKEGAMPYLTSLQLLQTTEETPEVTTPWTEAALQVGVASEISFPQSQATPQVTAPQLEAQLQTVATLEFITQDMEITEDSAEIESDLGVQGLTHLVDLNEVILHHSASDATVRDWKTEAKKHSNRPHVKKQLEANIKAE